uniref:Uncharacterized protein n=1 Tax=Ditylenchus dipsaci TaxID=166011 RepID=A0A915DC95_9BILA
MDLSMVSTDPSHQESLQRPRSPSAYLPISMRKTSAPAYHQSQINNHITIQKLHMDGPQPLSLVGQMAAATVRPKMVDSSSQTISTGEITVLNIYYDT